MSASCVCVLNQPPTFLLQESDFTNIISQQSLNNGRTNKLGETIIFASVLLNLKMNTILNSSFTLLVTFVSYQTYLSNINGMYIFNCVQIDQVNCNTTTIGQYLGPSQCPCEWVFKESFISHITIICGRWHFAPR